MHILFAALFLLSACSSVEKAPEAPPVEVFNDLDKSLYDAVRKGEIEKAKELFTQGANPRVVGIIDDTLFHEAIFNRLSIPMLDLLLEYKVPVDVKNGMDVTPFAMAINSGQYKTARWFLNNGANVNQRDMFRTPLLFNLIEKNDTVGMRLMMEYRACPYGVSFINKSLESITPEGLSKEVQEYVKFYREKISPNPPLEWQKEDNKK